MLIYLFMFKDVETKDKFKFYLLLLSSLKATFKIPPSPKGETEIVPF